MRFLYATIGVLSGVLSLAATYLFLLFAMFLGGGVANVPGYSGGNLYEVQDALRVTTTWRQGQVEGMSLPFYGPVMAVASG